MRESSPSRVSDVFADQIAAGYGGLAAWRAEGLNRGAWFFYGNSES